RVTRVSPPSDADRGRRPRGARPGRVRRRDLSLARFLPPQPDRSAAGGRIAPGPARVPLAERRSIGERWARSGPAGHVRRDRRSQRERARGTRLVVLLRLVEPAEAVAAGDAA